MEVEKVVTSETTNEAVVTSAITKEVAPEPWKAPESKEALDAILKAEANRTYTKALKDLGVNSVKEFLESKTKLEQDRTNYDNILKEKKDLTEKTNNLEKELYINKIEGLFNKLNILEDYKEDIGSLAMEQVTDEKSFESVLTEMSKNPKYQFAFKNASPVPNQVKPGVKMGIEKQNPATKSNVTETLAKKYPWLKD